MKKFMAFCEQKGIESDQAQRLYTTINEDPSGFKAQLHQAWPGVFEAPEAGSQTTTG